MVDGLCADEQDGADTVFGGDGDVGQDNQPGYLRISECRNDANIGLASRERSRASRWEGVADFEAPASVAVFEIPHQGNGVQEGNGRNAQARHETSSLTERATERRGPLRQRHFTTETRRTRRPFFSSVSFP